MKNNPRLICLAVLVFSTITACKEADEKTAASGGQLADVFSSDTIVVINDDGDEQLFDVYMAVDYEQKKRGLMFVREMPDRRGMLFVYDETDYHSMWMKNTYISLDMIFARSDGSVSSVIHDTVPLSLTSQGSIEPVNYVLELNAGSARRLNIGPNSRIVWDGLISQ